MAAITIQTALIDYEHGVTQCLCLVAATTAVGPSAIAQTVSLLSADLPPDWTDGQLCAAVAASLGVPASDVAVATAG